VWLAAGLAALCYAAIWTPAGPPETRLVNWLTSHHYTDGLAEYWQGSTTTVVSGGKVLVAPITPVSLTIRPWEASIDWYDPAQRTANFVIAATNPNAAPGGLSVSRVRAHFGRPAREYTVGAYVVMVYDYNLLTRVGSHVFPGSPVPAHPAQAALAGYWPGLRAITRNCLPSSRHSAGVCR
jgi:hypothetical protein